MTEGWGNFVFSVADESGMMSVDSIGDPNGPPSDVLDSNSGFSVAGKLEVSGSLMGIGIVRLKVEEIDGSFEEVVSRSTISIDQAAKESGKVTYHWETPVQGIRKPKGPKPYRLKVSFDMETLTGEQTDVSGFVDIGTFEID